MTSPKEENASFKDFSSTDHDNPAKLKKCSLSSPSLRTQTQVIEERSTERNGFKPPTKSLLFETLEGGEQ